VRPGLGRNGRVDKLLRRTRQERQCTYNLTQARSRNHCCRGKSISITRSEYVTRCSYPAYRVHAPYCIVICGLSGCTRFFECLTNGAIFGKRVVEYKMCVLIFSRILFKTFPIVRIIKRCVTISVRTSSCKVPVILVRF
jgi:hypothetical protein